MAQQNRTKELWLIPKRVNLHQTVCLIDGIIERKYDNTSWNPQKQNNLGVNLKKWGATNDGKNISPQAVRTLVASIPQYLGFLYINTETNPNQICLTKAGKKLWEESKEQLVKIPNLRDGKDKTIKTSPNVLSQMEKLQITNPIILKDCENICLFPFRFMLSLLQRLKYLDQEEIAYFLFKSRYEDEIDLVEKEILNFRKLSIEKREEIINAFKKTHVGNITLVKASSAGYFMSLCEITGIIQKEKITPVNKKTSLVSIKISSDFEKYVSEEISKKYKGINPFDFGSNLKLWIDYIGDPERLSPPMNIKLKNISNRNIMVQIFKENQPVDSDLIEGQGIGLYPMFPNEEYCIKCYNPDDAKEESSILIKPTYSQTSFVLKSENNSTIENDTKEFFIREIKEHCDSKNFTKNVENKLKMLAQIIKVDKLHDKSLRGAYLEYYFFKLLTILKNEHKIDDCFWNGKIGKYHLPSQAPGGIHGEPDIIFKIDDNDFVLELTTIKSKSEQFKAEGSSVPDHVRLYKEKTSRNVIGIFAAPILHQRNVIAMHTASSNVNVTLKSITIFDLLNILNSNSKSEIIKGILSINNT